MTKNFSLITSSVLCAFFLSVQGFAEMQEVTVQGQNIHIPSGFDSNDNIELVVTGSLPNTCYRRPQGVAKVNDTNIEISIKAQKIVDNNVACIMAVVPYMVSIPIGQLEEGKYEVAVNPKTSHETNSTLVVQQPNSHSIDDFTYANVTYASKVADTPYLLIEGMHPSSCMELEKVEVFANESNDTYSVLPIIKQVGDYCDARAKPFTFNLKLDAPENKNVIAHIRKLDGNALNVWINK